MNWNAFQEYLCNGSIFSSATISWKSIKTRHQIAEKPSYFRQKCYTYVVGLKFDLMSLWFNVFQIWLIHSQNVNIILLFLSNWVSTPLPWLFFLRWDLYIPSKVDCLTSQWRIYEIVVTFEWWFQCDIFYQTRPSLLLYENRNVTIKNTSFPWRSLLLAVNTVVVRIWTFL